MTRRVGIVYDERYFWHRSWLDYGPFFEGDYQLEEPAPRRRTLQLLDRAGLLERCVRLPAVPVDSLDLLRIHAPEYLDRLQKESAAGGGEAGDYAPFAHGSFEIACLAAGGAWVAMDAVITGEVDCSYALVRPPGHHAERDRGRGYCLLANIPIAIQKLRAERDIQRVAVVDWDVHHGNGTQWLFYDDPDVLAISLHQSGLYPSESGTTDERGNGSGEGATINIPLPPGSGRGAYEHALAEVVVPALQQARPELIVIACGFDAGGYDPNGRMMLSQNAFGDMTRTMLSAAADLCGGRLAVIQEGGYSSIHTPFCGAETVAALLDVDSGIVGPGSDHDGREGQALVEHQRHAVAAARAAADLAG